MTLIDIYIHDEGEHWHKTVKLFGLTVYHRHDYTKCKKERTIGFNTMAPVSGEIDDEDYWEEEKYRQSI